MAEHAPSPHEKFEEGVASFLRDRRGEGNKDIENACKLLAETDPEGTLALLISAIDTAKEKWGYEWKSRFADLPSGLVTSLWYVVPKCSDCSVAVPHLKDLAHSYKEAVEALGFSKDESVIDWLEKRDVAGKRSGEIDLKYYTMARIGGPKAAKILIPMLVRLIEYPGAIQMLSAIGNDAIAPLVDAFDQPTKSFSETTKKLLALKALRALGWEPQTMSQRIWVAVVGQDRHQLELFGLPHLKEIHDAFYAAALVDAASRQARVQFRHECIESILQNAQPALWLQLMKDGPFDDIAAEMAAERGNQEVFSQFAELCRSGRFLKEMTRFADRFPNEATDLLIRLAGDTSAHQDTRMSAAAWLLTRGHPEAYRIVPTLTVAIYFPSYATNAEWSMARWSEVTGISEDLLACASKAFCYGVHHSANRRECEAAIQKLCSIRNALSSAVLQRVAVMPDNDMSNPDDYVDLSYLRAEAQAELNSRQSESESLERWYRNQAKLSVPAKPLARHSQETPKGFV